MVKMLLVMVMVMVEMFVDSSHRRRWRREWIGGEGVDSKLITADLMRERGGIGFV